MSSKSANAHSANEAAARRSHEAGTLTASYARWRASTLGRITDGIETRLVLDMAGALRGLRVLDVGCGDGALAVELARRGAHVTGVDADPVMIAAARDRAEGAGLPVQFIRGAAEALPFPADYFDLVASVALLCLVERRAQAVSEMARVLRAGGTLLIGELGAWSIWSVLRRLRGWLGVARWRRAHFHTPSALGRLARSAGLAPSAMRGAIYYPPLGWAARAFAPIDLWLGRRLLFGEAFLVMTAGKPSASEQKLDSDQS